jgi:hypothetical protein
LLDVSSSPGSSEEEEDKKQDKTPPKKKRIVLVLGEIWGPNSNVDGSLWCPSFIHLTMVSPWKNCLRLQG